MSATLYRGGRVLPLDGSTAVAEALLESYGRVAAVGPLAELRSLAGPRAQEVDLDGAALLPGFVDTHPHVLYFGVFSWPLADLSDARSHADLIVVDRDPLSCPDDSLAATRVLRTVVGGRVVHDDGSLGAP